MHKLSLAHLNPITSKLVNNSTTNPNKYSILLKSFDAVCFFCHATAAQSKDNVFPVPVGDSKSPFSLYIEKTNTISFKSINDIKK
jgi:hypothetical protein